ncbi:MAG TPA: transglutaminase-like domain-containing protein [Vicinamibacteria bacterium]|nr:transglutaminase-like domain-containing protein [Vicinamibacteria bacterium]
MSSSSYLATVPDETFCGESEESNGSDRSYLAPSAFCDSDHPLIRAIALELTKDCSSDAERVAVLSNWVRDRIGYRIPPYPQAASDTLNSKAGSCSNRANLLVALLRSLNIPSGFHLLKVEAKDCFGRLASPVFHPFPDGSSHVFCAVQLGNKWVRCDPSKWHMTVESAFSES